MLKKLIHRMREEDDGATSIEYGLVAALMAGALIILLTTLGPHLKGAFVSVGEKMATPPDVTSPQS